MAFLFYLKIKLKKTLLYRLKYIYWKSALSACLASSLCFSVSLSLCVSLSVQIQATVAAYIVAGENMCRKTRNKLSPGKMCAVNVDIYCRRQQYKYARQQNMPQQEASLRPAKVCLVKTDKKTLGKDWVLGVSIIGTLFRVHVVWFVPLPFLHNCFVQQSRVVLHHGEWYHFGKGGGYRGIGSSALSWSPCLLDRWVNTVPWNEPLILSTASYPTHLPLPTVMPFQSKRAWLFLEVLLLKMRLAFRTVSNALKGGGGGHRQ